MVNSLKDILEKYRETLQPLMNDKKFFEVYKFFNHEFTFPINANIVSDFTESLYAAGVDPLTYTNRIPAHFLYDSTIDSFDVPLHIEYIGKKAFSGSDIKTITFNKNSVLENIHDDAFAYCHELEEIELPQEVLIIGDYAFKDCSKLRKIFIPKEVGTISLNAFTGCRNLTIYSDDVNSKSMLWDELTSRGFKVIIRSSREDYRKA